MRSYVWIDAGGDQCFGATDGALPKGAREVPRLPGPFERWDDTAGDFTYDAEGHANHLAGPAHIAEMRMQKAIEARLIAGGIVSDEMLLAKEAVLRGVSARDMADIVLAKVAAAVETELDRQAVSLTKSKGVNDGRSL